MITDYQVCKAYQKFLSNRGNDVTLVTKFADSYLMEMTGKSKKECLAAMEKAADLGLIEYVITLRSGWLSHKGYNLIHNTEGTQVIKINIDQLNNMPFSGVIKMLTDLHLAPTLKDGRIITVEKIVEEDTEIIGIKYDKEQGVVTLERSKKYDDKIALP